MKDAIRLGVIVALMLGANMARADHDPYTENAPHPQEQATPAGDQATPAAETAMAKAASTSGAGGMEPREAIDEDPGQGFHQEWVESIWESP